MVVSYPAHMDINPPTLLGCPPKCSTEPDLLVFLNSSPASFAPSLTCARSFLPCSTWLGLKILKRMCCEAVAIVHYCSAFTNRISARDFGMRFAKQNQSSKLSPFVSRHLSCKSEMASVSNHCAEDHFGGFRPGLHGFSE